MSWLDELARYGMAGRFKPAQASPEHSAIYVAQPVMYQLLITDIAQLGFDRAMEEYWRHPLAKGMWREDGKLYYTLWRSGGFGFTSSSTPPWDYQPFPRGCHMIDEPFPRQRYTKIVEFGSCDYVKAHEMNHDAMMRQAHMAAMADPPEKPEWDGLIKLNEVNYVTFNRRERP